MVIVDASIAYKWFTKEEDSDLALNILQEHINGHEKIVAPDLILYELVNAWVTKTVIPIPIVKTNLKNLQDAGLEIENPTFELVLEAATIAKKYRISVYDGYYLVLAKKKKCDFITADAKLVSKVNLSLVKLLSDYVKENSL